MLQSEVDSLSGAKEGTPMWVLLQAKSFGLSWLKKSQHLEIIDPVELDKFRKRERAALMSEKLEASDEIVRVP